MDRLSSPVKDSRDKDEDLMFMLSPAGSGDGCLLGRLGFLRLEKLTCVHVPGCFCSRQLFSVSSVYYAFSSPCAAIWGPEKFDD